MHVMGSPPTKYPAFGDDVRYQRHIKVSQPKGLAVVVGVEGLAAEVYRLAFALKGFRVALARDGEEGVHRVLSQQLPDVIVVDLGLPRPYGSMPRRDALEFLSVLRSIRVYETVPVIALTDDR